MRDEQINEVMRLGDVIENLAWSAGKTEQYHDEPTDYAEKLPAARAELETYLRTIGAEPSFQQRVQPWMLACFGAEIAADKAERNHRFLEEALELVQATGCTAGEAHQIVDYVYGRPVGDPPQEVGGVKVTLAALCLAHGIDMHSAAETELARIWTKVEQIRAKQAAKPKHSPLPVQPKPVQSVNAELLAIVHQTVGLIENTSIETGYCCCGDGMDGHASPMICGHSATDQGAYLAGLLYEDAKAAIAAAKSINEINALPDVPARELTDETIQRHWDEACKDTRKPMDGADTSVSPAPSADS